MIDVTDIRAGEGSAQALRSRASSAPVVWICCARYGESEKSYIEWHVRAFARIKPVIVTWSDHRQTQDGSAPVAVIPHDWRTSGRRKRLLLSLGNLGRRNKLGAFGAEFRSLRDVARQYPPRLIYAHTGPTALKLLPLARSIGCPLTAHFHGIDIAATRTDSFYRRSLENGLPAMAGVFIAGRYMRNWFLERQVESQRIFTAPMGAPVSAIRCVGESTSVPGRFLAMGRLVRYKGFDRVIRAFAEVHRKAPYTHLHIVGSGPLDDELRRLAARLGLTWAVTFIGSTTHEAAMREMAECEVFVHHALDEPDGPEAFGIVITEAMASGKPVVSTWCGGIPDQIDDQKNGLLVAQDDVDGMAACMLRLTSDKDLRQRLGRAARATAERHFEARQLAGRIESVFLDLLTGC